MSITDLCQLYLAGTLIHCQEVKQYRDADHETGIDNQCRPDAEFVAKIGRESRVYHTRTAHIYSAAYGLARGLDIVGDDCVDNRLGPHHEQTE